MIHARVGQELFKKVSVLPVDFDAPASQPRVIRHCVTGLPTTVFLRPDGRELDRIVGYEGKESYLAEARAILAGRDGLQVARDRLIREPENLELRLKVGTKLLLRGRESEARRHLDRVLREDRDNRKGLAARVMMLRGRYLVRVRRDYPAAVRLLREAVRRYGASRAGKGLRYWLGWALCKAGRPREAIRTLDAYVRERGGAPGALLLAAGLRRHCKVELPRALALAREATRRAPKNDWAWFLVADLAAGLGHSVEARKAIARAVSLDPKSAFYRHAATRIGGAPRK